MRVNTRWLISFRLKSETFNELGAGFGFLGLMVMLCLLAVTTVRAQTAGSLDASFDGDGKVSLDVDTVHNEAFAVAVQPDGKILIAGNNVGASPEAIILARYTTAGALDATFGNAGVVALELDGVSCQIRSIAVQPDGKILLAGNKTVGLSGSDVLVVRFNANGTLDTTFDTDGWTTTDFSHNDSSYSMVVQPDGKIIVVGFANRQFNVYEGDFVLARYNANGSPDTTFDGDGKLLTAFDALAVAYSVALQPDGKIVVAGENQLTIPHSNADFAVARYNPDGSLDATFGAGGKVTTDFNNSYASSRSLAILADGKILVGGESLGAANNLDFALARYNANGSLDATFGTNGKVTTNISGNDNIGEARSLAVQADGKIILAGTVGTNNEDFGVVRYHANGSLDASFGASGKVITDFGSPGDAAAAVAIQADGKILVAGKAMITFLTGTTLRYSDFALARYHAGTIAAPRRTAFDFDGDAKADVSVFRPSTATWYLNRSTQGFIATTFGIATDKLASADFDGDGKTDVTVFRDGNWYILQSTTNQLRAVQFGTNGDVPVPADYDGDGLADVAVFRSGTWYILDSSTNQLRAVQFGITSDKLVPADYDGDGKADVAVFRSGTWYILRSRDGFTSVQFGVSGDVPVVGDYDADGRADVAVFRQGSWYVQQSRDGFAAHQFGAAGDVPVPADYDGDGRTDVAVFRQGNWYVQRSTSGFMAIQFGQSGDVAMPSPRVP